jgi:hypothetical protein
MASPVEFLGMFLPLLPFIHYFVFSVFVLTYGRIAMFGYRTHSSRLIKIPVFFGAGFFSLFCGISLSDIILGGTDPITMLVKVLMLDVFVSGLVCSIVVAVGIFLVSRNIYNLKGLRKSLERLQGRIKSAEQAARTPLARRMLGPTMLAGIIILLGLFLYSALNFQGIPTYTERVSSALGIPLEDIEGMLGTGEGTRPAGCESVLSILMANIDDFTEGNLNEYTDPNVEGLIETASGSDALIMYSVQHSGSTYILAPTDDNRVCSAKMEGGAATFCECFDLSMLPF